VSVFGPACTEGVDSSNAPLLSTVLIPSSSTPLWPELGLQANIKIPTDAIAKNLFINIFLSITQLLCQLLVFFN
jgi:hypothetical protein